MPAWLLGWALTGLPSAKTAARESSGVAARLVYLPGLDIQVRVTARGSRGSQLLLDAPEDSLQRGLLLALSPAQDEGAAFAAGNDALDLAQKRMQENWL